MYLPIRHGGHQGFGQLGSGFDDQNDDFLAEEALMMLEEDISDIPNPPMTSSQQKMMRPGYHRESSSKQISQMIATLTPDVKKGLHDILQRAESGKSSDSGQEAFQEALNYLSQTARSDSNMRMDIERPQDLLLDLHSNHSSLNSETMQALIDVVMDTSGNEGTSAKSGKSDGSLDSVTRRMLFELASNPSMLEPDYNPIHSNSTIDSYYSYCQSLSGPSSALYYSSNSSNNNPQFDFNSTDDNNHNNGNNSNNKKANKNNKEKESKEKARGSYRCGRCGLPKVNHVCQVVEAASHSVSVQASNSTAIVDTSSGMPTPFTGEKFISVGGGNRNKNPSFVDRSSPSLASSSSLMDIAPDDASTISFGVYNNNASGATMSPFYSADSDSSKRMEGVTEEAMDEDDQEEESKKRQSSYFCSVDREQADTQCFPFFCF